MTKVNLLRLRFANILSFKDEQEIFFTAESKYTNIPTEYIRNERAIGKDMITPVTAFYGANASGKSNIIKVLTRILSELLYRSNKKENDSSYVPFLLDKTSKNSPSYIEIDFCVESTRYIFNCLYTNKGIVSESLMSIHNENKIKLYNRKSSEINYYNENIISKYDIQYASDSMSKRKDLLLIDILDTRGVTEVREAYKGLKRIARKVEPNFILNLIFGIDDLAETLYEDSNLLSKVVEFIKYADLGITDIKIEENKNPEIAKLSKTNRAYDIQFEHKGLNQEKYFLPIADESCGTSQYFRYLTLFTPAFLNGGIFIVDELDENLHPMMLAKLVEMFNNPNINIAGAQLIFTTHNTSILRSNILKRDEIWFVEKNEEGCSEVYPLTEFKAIREGFNYEKGYLEGRFGAIPYLGDIKELEDILNEKR